MFSIADAWAVFTAWPTWFQTLTKVAVVVILGWIVARVLDRRLDRALKRNKFVDDTTRTFLVRTLEIGIWAVIAVVVLGVIGVDPAALAGGLAVGGFVVGFALKDTLGNLAAGLVLLIYRPFNVGETVVIDGNGGDVISLGMALTVLKAGDGRLITMPNGKVLSGTITNHSREQIRRADVAIGIGYQDDVAVASEAILAALATDPRVLAEPAPSIRITELGENSVGLQIRPWVTTSDYWKAKADLHGTVKDAVMAAGCSIPFPQRDVHLHQTLDSNSN